MTQINPDSRREYSDPGAPIQRDPAPSRLSYRLQRLMLTPVFRLFLRAGLPALAAFATGAYVMSDQTLRDGIGLRMTEFRRMIEERPEFMVSLMAIDGAGREVSEDIRDILPIDFPVSGFDLNLESMRREIALLDAVAAVSLRIREGGILQIDITERVPAVVWRGPQGVEALDQQGHRTGALLARAERPDLPLITGEGANLVVPEALALLSAAGPVAPRLRGLVRVGARRWDVVLDRDQRILLPAENPVQAFARVIALHSARQLLDRDITHIDMRIGRRPTLRLAEGARQELRRIRSDARGN